MSTTATAAGSIEGIRSAIAKGETTAKAVTEIYQARIAGEDPKIHAFLSVDREYALAQAVRNEPGSSMPATAPGRSSASWRACRSASRMC